MVLDSPANYKVNHFSFEWIYLAREVSELEKIHFGNNPSIEEGIER